MISYGSMPSSLSSSLMLSGSPAAAANHMHPAHARAVSTHVRSAAANHVHPAHERAVSTHVHPGAMLWPCASAWR